VARQGTKGFVYVRLRAGATAPTTLLRATNPRRHRAHRLFTLSHDSLRAPRNSVDIIQTLPTARAQCRTARCIQLLRQCTRFDRITTPTNVAATGLMTAIIARSPLQSLPMATNRPTTRRRSVKQAFEDDEAPAPKRPRTDVNGASKRANGTTKKAAKVAYDEDDDGFQFSRRTTRKTTKAQPAPAPEPIPEERAAKSAHPQDSLPAKSTARRKKDTIAAIDPETSDSQKRRRSTRLSGDQEHLEPRPNATEPPTAKRTKKSAPVEKERKKQVTPAPEAQLEEKSVLAGTKTPTQNELHVAKRRDPNAQRIMLPFADTPVITRNKEMRKGSKDGHRRSSTGLRGRRASSLIDSGMSNGEFTLEIEDAMIAAWMLFRGFLQVSENTGLLQKPWIEHSESQS
jgi:hypothetical protein